MKAIVYYLMLTGFAAVSLGQPEASSASAGEEAAVHKVVDEIVAAIDRNDADSFDRLSTTDYTFVNPAGKVWNKKQYLDLIRSGTLKVESYTRDEESIRFYGNTAVVIYRSTPHGTFKGQQLIDQRRVTTILVKQDGRWLTAGRQSTPIFQPKPSPTP
ncbi:MAG: nuclear transport factor 2 family protein [Chthoniobacterales bacterium]